MLGNGIANVLDGVVGDLEFVAVRVEQRPARVLHGGLIAGAERRERGVGCRAGRRVDGRGTRRGCRGGDDRVGSDVPLEEGVLGTGGGGHGAAMESEGCSEGGRKVNWAVDVGRRGRGHRRAVGVFVERRAACWEEGAAQVHTTLPTFTQVRDGDGDGDGEREEEQSSHGRQRRQGGRHNFISAACRRSKFLGTLSCPFLFDGSAGRRCRSRIGAQLSIRPRHGTWTRASPFDAPAVPLTSFTRRLAAFSASIATAVDSPPRALTARLC